MTPGAAIAHYRITSKLGEGGMGAVYRATDTKLNREVAIKVLPEAYSQDADRMARFAREAQVLAGLNHPNIAAIYGLEERSLVLELVEGPDLAERIARGPIPLDEALPIARQLAEALEYAHERGIIHRDLKPANLKVTPEGKLKVLDFGLAKALTSESGTAASSPMSSPTMTMRATVAGVIMGTAGYMSPEQAKGKPVDRRADIWAFGVVFAEMLTGEMMYSGETVSETLASVIKDQPALDKLPAGTPAHIRRLLRRCLEKDPQRRLQAIGEARIAIDEQPREEPPPAMAQVPPARRSSILGPLAGLAAGLALMAGVTMWRAPKPEDRPLLRFNTDMGPDAVLGTRSGVILSPDGSRVAYSVRQGSARLLATRLLDQTTETILPGTEGINDSFFSPDGKWIGFSAAGKLKKVSVQGGAPLDLCAVGGTRGATWSENGFIYLSSNGAQLYRVPAAGGTPEIVSHPEQHGERWHRNPQALPGGTSLLVTVMAAGAGGSEALSDSASVAVLSLKTGLTRTVVKSGYLGRYVPGYLLYVLQSTLFAVKFDADRMEVKGEPVPVVSGIATGETGGGAFYNVARNGTMVYASGLGTRSVLPVVWVDAGGTRPLIADPPGRVVTPRLSPDGQLLAAAIRREIWVLHPERGTSTRLTSKIDAQYPVWTPDGKYIAFAAGPNAIGWVRADGSSPSQLIYQAPNTSVVPQSFTSDGRQLLFHQGHSTDNNNRDIYVLPVDATDPEHPKAGTPQIFVATETADVDSMLSPDGHWVAYATNVERENYQVFVRPFPPGAPGAQVQVSGLPGRFPLWSRTSKELFYVTTEGRIQVMPYSITGQSFVPGKAHRWSEQTIQLSGVTWPIDIAPNGKSFAASLAVAETTADTNLHLTFLVNFLDELKRKLP